jgi:hypothetical protein
MQAVLDNHVKTTLLPLAPDLAADPLMGQFACHHSTMLADLGGPNAAAWKSRPNHYAICFTPEMLLALFELALLYSYILEKDTKTPVGASFPLTVRQDAFVDYEFILAGETAIRTNNDQATFHFLSCFTNRPNSNEYLTMAVVLFDFALAWICLHERAHIVQGHVDYVIQTQRDASLHVLCEAPIFQLDALTLSATDIQHRKCLEMDADAAAANEVLSRSLQPSTWSLYNMCPYPRNRDDAIIMTVVMVIATLTILKKMELARGGSPLYPTAEERITYTVVGLLAYANPVAGQFHIRSSMGGKHVRPDDWKAIMRGCLEAKKLLDRLNTKHLPSFEVDEENGFPVNAGIQESIRILRYEIDPDLSKIVPTLFQEVS